MWIWREDREDTAGGSFDRHDRARGGWHVDTYGAWNWQDEHPARGGLALLPAPSEAWSVPDEWADETPIFNAVSDDHSRRARLRPIEGAASWAAIPEPNPGSGPLPIQDPSGRARSGHLAAVPTVPPPSEAGDDREGLAEPVRRGGAEDELRRRAERRRRPRTESTERRGAGRHAMRDDDGPVSGGRHALEH